MLTQCRMTWVLDFLSVVFGASFHAINHICQGALKKRRWFVAHSFLMCSIFTCWNYNSIGSSLLNLMDALRRELPMLSIAPFYFTLHSPEIGRANLICTYCSYLWTTTPTQISECVTMTSLKTEQFKGRRTFDHLVAILGSLLHRCCGPFKGRRGWFKFCLGYLVHWSENGPAGRPTRDYIPPMFRPNYLWLMSTTFNRRPTLSSQNPWAESYTHKMHRVGFKIKYIYLKQNLDGFGWRLRVSIMGGKEWVDETKYTC